MKGFENSERMEARRYDDPNRASDFTRIVYGGGVEKAGQKLKAVTDRYEPTPSEYAIYFGEMHGHTNLSDGHPDIDEYFRVARDEGKLDFCAISDHDHGGVFSTELWDPKKWSRTQEAVRKFHVPHVFTPILAYERDSYPWYNNLVIYFNSYDHEIPRGSVSGEITKAELSELLHREDLIVIPHTTSFLSSGCDFEKIPLELMTPFIEVYSRWGTDEYFGNPNPVRISCRGGFWQDALKKGARMGCICGSDDHEGTPGVFRTECHHPNLKYTSPGLTAVLAKDNTLPALFEALKARRCYGLMGGRIYIDFRIDGHYMGEEIEQTSPEKIIHFQVKADAAIKRISLVKNCEDYMHFDGMPHSPEQYNMTFLEYGIPEATDYYYLRVELEDGRFAWTSPIWVTGVNREE